MIEINNTKGTVLFVHFLKNKTGNGKTTDITQDVSRFLYFYSRWCA